MRHAMAILVGASLAMAQDEPPTDPELSDPSIDKIVREMIDGADGSEAIRPRRADEARPAGQLEGPLLPGLSVDGYEIGAPPLLPEDTFISRRRGRLLRLTTGDWAFVFHDDPESRQLQPMIVLPCRELERVEGVIADPSVGAVLAASGRVYAYRGRNYLLPNTRHGLVPVQTAAPQPEETTDPGVANVLEPEIADIVAALEAEREAHRPLTPLKTEGGPSDVEGFSSVLKEGTFVLRRRGRMVRLASGQWAFMIDADSGDDPTNDPAMVIAPCRNLMLMEQLAADRGDNLVMELTGHTLVYKHRAYVVPMMYQVLFTENVRPLQ